MIEFTLGMSAEEYLRKHRSLLNLACDVLSSRPVKALDKRRLPDSSGYLFYYQIPTSHPVTLHAFVVSSHKSLRNIELENGAFADRDMMNEVSSKVRMSIWIAVGFDTPLGKHVYFSMANRTDFGQFTPSHYNLLLSPQFIESYQSRTPKTYARNVLHKFILEEVCGNNFKGASAVFNDYGHFSARCCLISDNGISFGHMFGDLHIDDETQRPDSSKCVVRLNSFHPNSLNPQRRLTDMIKYHSEHNTTITIQQ